MNRHLFPKWYLMVLLALAFVLSSVQFVDAATSNWKPVAQIKVNHPWDVAWSPDGQQIAIAEDGVGLYDSQYKFIARLGDLSSSVAWNKDGTLLAARQNSQSGDTHKDYLRIWDMKNQQIYAEFPVSTNNLSFSWSPDTNVLAYNDQAFVTLWDAATRQIRHASNIPIKIPSVNLFQGPNDGYIWSLGWSPDGNHIAITTVNWEVFIWNVQTSLVDQVFHAPQTIDSPLIWAPDGEKLMLSEGHERQISLFNLETGKQTEVEFTTSWFLFYIAWSPDGRFLATDGPNIYGSAVWDTTTWQLVTRFPDREERITGLAWSPDSQLLAVAADDGIVQFWQRPMN